MGKKLAILSLVLIMIVLTTIFFLASKVSRSPQISEDCNTLIHNGNDAFNIVFFSTRQKAEEYSKFLLETPPFDKNPYFNFYYIDKYKPTCKLYRGIALLCNDRETIKTASLCPNDFIVVLEDQPREIRSSAYMNIMSLNSNHPKSVFTHEFGHAFANLADEYTPAELPRNSQNCVDNCEKFEGIVQECLEGCSRSNFFRSINNGVMRTLSSNIYGAFNEKIIIEKLSKKSSTITGRAISEQRNCGEYYLIEGVLENKEVKVISKSVEQGCYGRTTSGDFKYEIITSTGITVYEAEFNPKWIFTDSFHEETKITIGEVFESDENFFIKIPIIPNIEKMKVSGDSIQEINIGRFDSIPCKK